MMYTPKKYQFIKKKWKNPKNKNSFIDMLQRLKSDHQNRPSSDYFSYFIERKTS